MCFRTASHYNFLVDHTRNKQNRIISATLNNNAQLDTKWCYYVSFCTVSAPATVVPCQPEEKLWHSLLAIRFKISTFPVLRNLCEILSCLLGSLSTVKGYRGSPRHKCSCTYRLTDKWCNNNSGCQPTFMYLQEVKNTDCCFVNALAARDKWRALVVMNLRVP